MRKIVMLIGLLAALLAGCAPAGQVGPTVESPPAEPTAEPALNPAPGVGEGYPLQEQDTTGYPGVSPEELAGGYLDPNSSVASPSEVNLGELTPVAGDLTPQVLPEPGRPGDSGVMQPALMLEAVVADLSAQSGVSAGSIELVSTDAITWPNTALGCPEEGVAYAEVMVEGSRITLVADGVTYFYHTDNTGMFVLCEDGVPVSSGSIPRQ